MVNKAQVPPRALRLTWKRESQRENLRTMKYGGSLPGGEAREGLWAPSSQTCGRNEAVSEAEKGQKAKEPSPQQVRPVMWELLQKRPCKVITEAWATSCKLRRQVNRSEENQNRWKGTWFIATRKTPLSVLARRRQVRSRSKCSQHSHFRSQCFLFSLFRLSHVITKLLWVL